MTPDQLDSLSPHDEAPDAGTKEKILDAAIFEFAEHGFEGARVDRIAEQARVNKAMLYYHFGPKEKLYEGVFSRHVQCITARLKSRATDQTNLEQLLLAILQGHIDVLRAAPQFGPIFLRELANPRHEMIERISRLFVESGLPSILRLRFQEAIDRGELRKTDIRQTAISFLTMSLGYIILSPLLDPVWGVTDRDAFLQERKSAIVDLLMNGVKVR